MFRTDKTIEIKGLLSTRGQMIARETLASLTRGQILTIITRDSSAGPKLAPLCESLGCTLLGSREEGGTFYVQIQR